MMIINNFIYNDYVHICTRCYEVDKNKSAFLHKLMFFFKIQNEVKNAIIQI